MPTLGAGRALAFMRAQFQLLIIVASALILMGSSVRAFEPGATFYFTPGQIMGNDLAVFGPPGVYFASRFSYGTNKVPKDTLPAGVTRYVDVPIESMQFRWTTPWKLFGASYAFTVAQSFVSRSFYNSSVKGPPAAFHSGVHNTIFSPGVLSWKFPHKVFVAAGIRFGAPDGAITGKNGLDNIGQPFWLIEPVLAFAYLDNGWDISANFLYDITTRNTISGVQNGDVIRGELAATKHFGRFEIGPTGYFAFQTTRDTGGIGGGFNSCAIPAKGWNGCARAAKGGVGGKLGYDFGPAKAYVIVSDSVLSRGVGGADGWRVWTQIAFKLFNPLPPSPSLAMVTR